MTIWSPPDDLRARPLEIDDTSIIVRDMDTRDSLEAHIVQTLDQEDFVDHFFTREIVDLPDGDIMEATLYFTLPERAERAQVEYNMAVSYYWNAPLLDHVNPNGVLVNPGAAPFGEEEARWVMARLAARSNYSGQQMQFTVSDGTIISYKEDE
jgi:hypothetical protein